MNNRLKEEYNSPTFKVVTLKSRKVICASTPINGGAFGTAEKVDGPTSW